MDALHLGRLLGARADPLTPTVFHENWWLRAASGGNFSEVSVTSGGRVVGRLPYMLTRMAAGCALCSMPELTHFLGPAVDAGRGSVANRALKHDGILRELLAKLPPSTGFYQKFHRGVNDTLVFQERGYRTAVQFTYEIAPAPEATLWAALRDKTRNVIRRAREQYNVVERDDPAAFTALYDANLRARNMHNHYPRIAPVCDAALSHNQGRVIMALDAAQRPVAAIFYVWDEQTAYYLLSTRSADASNSAVSLLVWSAICDSVARGLIFDFDGVATPGSRVFYTGFGGTVAPRYIVSRYSLIHRVTGRLSNPFRRPTKETYQF